MIIKKFVGKTEEDAIAAAKKQLGEGVVIMNVRNAPKKGLRGLFAAKQIEVTVALEEEPVRQPVRDNVSNARSAETHTLKETVGLNTKNNNSDSIEKKLDSLQTLLENQMRKNEEEKAAAEKAAAEKAAAEKAALAAADSEKKSEETSKEADKDSQSDNPELDKFIRLLYNTMIDNEVAEKNANQILEDIDSSKKTNMPMDYLLANIYQKMILKFGKSEGVAPAKNGPKVVLFVGPTGVGKTTTIAKLASNFSVQENKKIVLLTADTYRIAAAEQLRTYANILEVPFRIIYTPEEFADAINCFKEFDYIFVDTTGHSHQNNEQLGAMKALLDTLTEVEYQTFLVLSATTKYSDLIKITEIYSDFTDYQLIFTKLDETGCLGNILNVRLQTGASIAYTTYGQNVPDDIEIFNAQKIVKQLLGGKK